MAERQIEHRKSCLVLSARFPVVNWRSRPVAKSAYYKGGETTTKNLSLSFWTGMPFFMNSTRRPLTKWTSWDSRDVIPRIHFIGDFNSKREQIIVRFW